MRLDARRVPERVSDSPAVAAVVALSLAALVARLVSLGDRIAHFDEGRVAYWALHYQETGAISYRYIVHGPLIQHVDALVFGVLGQTDFAMRLPVAVFGGLLPLSALLFRERLRRSEVVALAAFLAFNPVLIYYSRFLRSTLLVAGFAFVAFGALVRAVDARRVRYVYLASALLALAFAAKENAVVYVLVWVGATVLVVDHLLFSPRTDESGLAVARRHWHALAARARSLGRRGLAAYAGHAVGVVLAFVLVAGFFFAPRDPGGVGLWSALANPTTLPALADATVADVTAGFEYWFGGATEPGCNADNLVDGYACYLGQFLRTLWIAALPLTVCAVGGFLYERFAARRPRLLVVFASYWGFVSVLGYPLGTDVYGAWITINAVVPLAVPAAVGVGWVVRLGRDAFVAGDRASLGLVAFACLLLVAQAGATAATDVYGAPAAEGNDLVQYAQPTDDYRSLLERADRVATEDRGPDVLVYGDALVNPDDEPVAPACADLGELLPMQWYLATADLNATCATSYGELEASVADSGPPLVVTRDPDVSLDGYENRTFYFRATGDRTTVFAREDVIAPPSGNRTRGLSAS